MIFTRGDEPMIWEVRMPRLDEDMEEGTINRWIKQEGDFVTKGEPIVEIETQKVNYQIEAPGSGILRLILMQKGDTVPINKIIAVIADAEEDLSSYGAPSPQQADKAVPPAEASVHQRPLHRPFLPKPEAASAPSPENWPLNGVWTYPGFAEQDPGAASRKRTC